MEKVNKPSLGSDPAVFTALWIGENHPDFFSQWIQIFLCLKAHQRNIRYSHNGLIFHHTGKLWHSTTTDDPDLQGVIEQYPTIGLLGCHIRFQKVVTLNCTNDFFAGWLEGERGKDYSARQNVGNIFPFLQPYCNNGDRARNCSEFLARACQWSSEFRFPANCDNILPTDTFRVILPEEVK